MIPQQMQGIDDNNLLESLLPNNDNDRSDSQLNNNTRNNENDGELLLINDNKDIVLHGNFFCCRCCKGNSKQSSWRIINHNVFFNLLLSASLGISQSLWNGTAYAAYIKKLGHDSNRPLGNIEALSGLAQLVTALPVGFLADRWGRSKVIRMGGYIRFLTIIVQVCVIVWVGNSNNDNSDIVKTAALFILGATMWFWGVGDGIINGPCAALYADSTPKGERSTYFNYLFIAYQGASVVGPLLSIVLFQLLGDDWTFADLRIVIYVGLGVEVFNSIYMLNFDDRKALEEENEDDGEDEDDDMVETDENTRENDNNNFRNDFQDESGLMIIPLLPSLDDNDSESFKCQQQKWIPYIIFAQDLIFAMGSGMTIKFFPLFFKDEIGMTPSQVQVIYCVIPLAIALCSTLGSKIAATGFGRVQTQLLFYFCGISSLYVIVFFQDFLKRHPHILVCVYIFRTSIISAYYPLQESILMDFVKKDVRARWKSLDAVSSFGWGGSAVFGGWLSDKYNYTHTFLITAIMQTIGFGIWALLLPLVPRYEKKMMNRSRAMRCSNNG